ncbi:hypothetical protein NGA_0450800 [Nannochloropsis gaditana CCMP526]|uniref:uncharacterized protein n=1 Tax=Nannochloropsis gaditana (strain CCMP526) TaxID=1093141 RepID=UPI00029F5387|nr:hypothetical protein NGA_0450800 [Nannochloropsis gaditana CCMP526]EKU22821.1 hypothetical protein NGA_0450800 [Nannochloropsis gaditana CCMP526]|eukprot:XP_005853538.1 hypothetical protein NGA_0450800 [Nannochloropsis gaditana CCMP526]
MQFHRELLSGTQERGGPKGEKIVNPKLLLATGLKSESSLESRDRLSVLAAVGCIVGALAGWGWV